MIRFSMVWRSCVLMAALFVHQVRRSAVLYMGEIAPPRHGLMPRPDRVKPEVCLTKSS